MEIWIDDNFILVVFFGLSICSRFWIFDNIVWRWIVCFYIWWSDFILYWKCGWFENYFGEWIWVEKVFRWGNVYGDGLGFGWELLGWILLSRCVEIICYCGRFIWSEIVWGCCERWDGVEFENDRNYVWWRCFVNECVMCISWFRWCGIWCEISDFSCL